MKSLKNFVVNHRQNTHCKRFHRSSHSKWAGDMCVIRVGNELEFFSSI